MHSSSAWPPGHRGSEGVLVRPAGWRSCVARHLLMRWHPKCRLHKPWPLTFCLWRKRAWFARFLARAFSCLSTSDGSPPPLLVPAAAGCPPEAAGASSQNCSSSQGSAASSLSKSSWRPAKSGACCMATPVDACRMLALCNLALCKLPERFKQRCGQPSYPAASNAFICATQQSAPCPPACLNMHLPYQVMG